MGFMRVTSSLVLLVLVVPFAGALRPHGRSVSQRVMEGILRNMKLHEADKKANSTAAVSKPSSAKPIAALQDAANGVVTESSVHQKRRKIDIKKDLQNIKKDMQDSPNNTPSKSTQQKKTHKTVPHRGPRTKKVVTAAHRRIRNANLNADHQSYRRVDLSKQVRHIKEEVARIHAKQSRAKAAAAADLKKMNAQARKTFVDKIWKPTDKNTEKVVKESKERAERQNDEKRMLSASVTSSFESARNAEMKTEKSLLKNSKGRSAPTPSVSDLTGDVKQAAENELAKAEKSVEAIATADDISKSTKADLKSNDPYAGLSKMEADAESVAVAADQEAEDEAKNKGKAEKRASEANKKLMEDAQTLVKNKGSEEEAPKKANTNAPQKTKHTIETLAEAEKKARAAEKLAEFSKVGEGLAKVWDGASHDKKLNSELAEDVKLNNQMAKERLQRVEAFEDDKKAQAIDDIDKQWQNRFPDAPSRVAEVKPHSMLSRENPASAKVAKPVSDWGTLANNLATGEVA